MADSYSLVAHSQVNMSGSTAVHTVSNTATAIGSVIVVGVLIPTTGVSIVGVTGTANSWSTLQQPVAITNGTLAGNSMALLVCTPTSLTAETVSVQFSAVVSGVTTWLSQEIHCLANTILTWFVDSAQGIYQTFNTTTNTAITLFAPAAKVNGECALYFAVSSPSITGITGTDWGAFVATGVGVLFNTGYPIGTGPTVTLSATGFIYALGVVLYATAKRVPNVLSEMGVM